MWLLFSTGSEPNWNPVVASLMMFDLSTNRWYDTGQSNIQICQSISDKAWRIIGSNRRSAGVSLSEM